ncbi:low-specificity L-threonine aldolase [Myxococcus sp. CA051A]|uniref:low-specificity L-threonine aldolase n=1 Tax=unclassified Myxococcus TaxID=2648731 RepID=UPI00157B5FA2|nr:MULTISPECIES: low-specificity L-threonine aldolase [unclassified Myxococcus]NTX04918.1 low-specificity L-threonine aldolase [Myxococcus sp. CA040A]NTX15269.1 low-specificity L-threonine aldolase [Myxococcus sp. CA056]NTX37978.1 low-specificity L-threonine aldolase [Myxococcus sp. CA033]NTX58510.1 low-specificity L-threonine aldolase [Myxococcus sp. CA039A]NTX61626.1 low-specificity L-threonine aldolase [Myxococcus sp. CA051A]
MKPIDFRSDTVTKPTAGMRRAIAEAEVGDDVYGEDPTVLRLEARVAERLGLEAAVFVPSGTQANQVAIGAHCRAGDEVLTEAGSHILHYEGGAVPALWGVQPQPLPGERGLLTPEDVAAAVREDNMHNPRTRLLSLENTHNRGGGSVWPVERFRAVVEVARKAGLAVHLDGARLFNAEVAAGVPASTWARLTDTTSVCFSKGLGAPVGSALAGRADLIKEARRLRKRLGGGMRQAGILAAAALYALDHHVERLAEDHANARRLAAALAEVPGVKVDTARVETNMVFAEFDRPALEMVTLLGGHGVLTNPAGGPRSVRLVTHLDLSAADIDESVARIRRALA